MLRFMGLQRVRHDLGTETQINEWLNRSPSSLKLLNFLEIQMCVCVCLAMSNSLQLHVAHQAPLSMEFSRQEYCSGLPFHPPRDLPNPGIKPASLVSPALKVDSLPLSHWGRSQALIDFIKLHCYNTQNCNFSFICLLFFGLQIGDGPYEFLNPQREAEGLVHNRCSENRC